MTHMYLINILRTTGRQLAGTTLLALAGLTQAHAQCAPTTTITTFPYTENFDGVAAGTLPCGYTLLDANSDANSWQSRSTVPTAAGQTNVSASAPNAMVYFWNTDGVTPGDDWFFTPGIPMQPGYTYSLSFKYRNSGSNYPEAMTVRYGTAATVAGQTNTLWTNNNIGTSTFVTANNTSTPAVANISPTTAGTYYIGFHVISQPDQFFLSVDDLQITRSGTATATQSAALNRAITVYPNPSQGLFTVEVAGIASKVSALQVQVTNVLGQVVHKGSVPNAATSPLDLRQLGAGIYQVKIQAGDEFIVRRLVIN